MPLASCHLPLSPAWVVGLIAGTALASVAFGLLIAWSVAGWPRPAD